MFLLSNKPYQIVEKDEHLLVEGEDGKLLLVDTGYNGDNELIDDASVFSPGIGARYDSAVWVGSLNFIKAGAVMDINYIDNTLTMRSDFDATDDLHAIPFSPSSSCAGVSGLLGCGLGPIVCVPTLVTQDDRTYPANAFVDTGSPMSMVLRSRIEANGMQTINVEECNLMDVVIPVEIDDQKIIYKNRPNLGLKFLSEQGSVESGISGMLIACGKNDALPSHVYNDKLALVDLSPYVDATAGNDALYRHGRVVFDYQNRIMYLGKQNLAQRAVRQVVEPGLNSSMVILKLLVLAWIIKTKPDPKISAALLLSMALFF